METFLLGSALLLAFIVWIYVKATKNHGFFESQGIAHEKPLPFIGNLLPMSMKKEGMMQFMTRMYQQFYNEKFFGFYGPMGKINLILRDPALVKKITIKDFEFFVNRDSIENSMDDLLSRSILGLKDNKWKEVRSMLSPIYTSSKMKYMYGLLVECIEEFMDIYWAKAKANNDSVEIATQDVFARVTADGISTTALGFKGDCVKNKESEIYKIAEALEEDFSKPVSMLFLFPWLFKLLGLQLFRKSIHKFFLNNVTAEMNRRREGKIVRPDVIQLLVQAREGQLKLESGDAEELTYTDSKLKKVTNYSDKDLVAQAMVLFLGGFETTANLMQTLSYELAHNQDVQQTLIDEVDDMLETLNGKKITYDQLNQMKFLEMVVNESLRKWPSFKATSRSTSKDYVLKDDETGQTYKLPKGTDIFIPIGDMQNDPKFFPNPEKFDPYRFSDDNKSNIESGAYIPFGLGPRICIGSRYALLEAKLLVFYLMSRFRIEKCSRTPDKLTLTFGNFGYNETICVALKLRK